MREEEVRGGLARRAALLTAAADPQAGTPARLIVEAGGLFDPSFAHEARRARLHLECLAAMGYDLVHLTAGDLALGPETIRKTFAGLSITQLATNVRPAKGSWAAVRAARREVAGVELIVVGLISPSEAPKGYKATEPAGAVVKAVREARGRGAKDRPGTRRRGGAAAAMVVVLSDLTSAENDALLQALPDIEIIISTRGATSEKLRQATVFPRTDGGRTVGRIHVESGRVEGVLLPLGGDLVDDTGFRARLTEYYRAVASASPAVAPLDPEAAERGHHYVGARTCAQCHEPSSDHWLSTPHSHAYETLVEARRHELPECVLCHATGVGHPAGFTTDRTRPYFAGVQCESCHGAGSVHSRLPARGTIRREVPAQVCLACHTPSQSPGYHADPAGYQARVVHREGPRAGGSAAASPAGASPSAASPAAAPPPVTAPRAERARVDLYIMSYCPYGGTAAQELAAVRDSLPQAIDVAVHYIVRSTEIPDAAIPPRAAGTNPPAGRPPLRTTLAQGDEACVDNAGAPPVPTEAGEGLARGLTSLHGPEEVIEDLRQIVIAERYPDRLLDYIARRAADPEGDWKALAARLGMDAGAIEAGLPAARPRLVDDAARVRSLGIAASPTLRLNGAALALAGGGGLALERAICSAILDPPARCAALPPCERDADCRAPGMEGRCVGAGRSDARCVLTPAPQVALHVLNDPTCGQCSPIEVVAGARELFANLEVVAHDVTRGAGKDWIEAFDIQSVPSFTFVGAESSASFPTLQRLVIPGKEGSLVNPEVFRGPLYFRREGRPRTVDFFLDATGEETLFFLRSLAEIAKSKEGGAALDSATVVFRPVLESGPPPAPGALRLVQRGDEAYLVPESELPQLRSRLGPEDMGEARRQVCIAMLGGRRILSYMLDRAEHGEVGAGDWRERCRRVGLDAAQIARCAGGGEADAHLESDRKLAESLGIRPPAALAGNRLRFDGLGSWNAGPFVRALGAATSVPTSDLAAPAP